MKSLLIIFTCLVLCIFLSAQTVSYGIDKGLFDGQDWIKGNLPTGLDEKKIVISYKRKQSGWKKLYSHRKHRAANDFFYNGANGDFLLRLNIRLEKSWLVRVEYKDLAAPQVYPAELVKSSPLILRPFNVGGSHIEGTVDTTYLGDPATLKLKCLLSRDDNPTWLEEVNLTTPFTIAVKMPIRLADSDVMELELTDDSSGELLVKRRCYIGSGTRDWGMIRSYLTLGVNISREEEQLKSTGSYLDFLLNTYWRVSRFCKDNLMMAYLDVRLHSYFFDPPQFSATQSQQILQHTTDLQSGNGNSVNIEDEEEPGEIFRTAVLEMGIHYPFTFGHWRHQGNRNAVFAGPIAKVGFQRFFSGSSGTALHLIDDQHLYAFYSFGIRSGHYVLSRCEGRAPRLNSYLDVTVGRSSAVRLEIIDENNPNDEPDIKWSWNVYIEGRIEIPNTPIILGINAFKSLRRGEFPDDFQIIIGTRMDLFALIDKILPKD